MNEPVLITDPSCLPLASSLEVINSSTRWYLDLYYSTGGVTFAGAAFTKLRSAEPL